MKWPDVTDSVVGTSYASESFVWTVNSSGSVTVTWGSLSNKTSTDEDSVSLSLSATDSASNALVYSAVNLPAGLSIDSSSGDISGVIEDGDSSSGPYTVTVIANDSVNPSVGATASFTWTVNELVSVTNPGTLANTDGDTVFLPALGTNSLGDPLTYSESGLPGGLQINAATGVISGTITASAGSYSVTVTATDSDNGGVYASTSFTWTVSSGTATTVTLSAVSDQVI